MSDDHSKTFQNMLGWWFRTCFIFPYIGNNHPNISQLTFIFLGLKPPSSFAKDSCAVQKEIMGTATCSLAETV